MRYIYKGDKLTAPKFRNQPCEPVRDERGSCVIGRKPRNQLVRFESGELCVVLARRLRLTEKL